MLTRTHESGDVSYEDIAARLDIPLLATVPDDPAVRESVYAGTPLVVHDPKSPAGVAYLRFALEIANVEAGPDDRSTTGTARGGRTQDDSDPRKEPDGGHTLASQEEVSSAISEVDSDSN